ncbi:hypothetical protein [Galbibacter sp.]|uniref:hypothetical protein n=1 Tax=Galbibacter sp. TaxID=2918471 RepID=UPI003A9233C9
MKKLLFLTIALTIIVGCSNDDEKIDCSRFDPVFPTLYIRVVDGTGANLIDNGTIDTKNISVEGDFSGANFQIVPVNEFAASDPDKGELNNSLRLFIPRKTTFQYTIILADIDETFTIGFTAEPMRLPCDITIFKPINGLYENQTLELSEFRSLQFVGDLEIYN